MKRFLRWRWRWLWAAMAALLLAALLLPWMSAGNYRDRVQVALESALGRKVEIGEVHFSLLPRPGIEISNVTIGEDPAIGVEFAAYVTTLRAVPSLTGLFGGPLRFSSVDLEDASLNLTRVDGKQGVRWNFAAMMRPAVLAAFPSVHMRGGRVNFKFGDTKSLFYLLNTDVDLWPPGSPQGPWTVRVHAEPARTDRPARGFGTFVVRGQWLPGDGSTTLDVRLEQSELGDMLTLFNGYESGMHGDIVADAHLAGPLNRIGVAGRMTISDVHGWNQAPPGGRGWRLAIGGAIDAPGQSVDLDAKLAGIKSPIEIRYRVADYLRRPRWGVTVNVNHLPLSPVTDIARNLGWVIPADFKVDGTADGAVGYSMPEGLPRMDGDLSLAESTLIVAGTPPLHIPRAEIRFSGNSVKLAATEIANDNKETAAIEATWDVGSQQLDASVSSGGMAIASLRRQISVAGIPLLGQATAGTWKGDLRYSGGVWTGALNLRDADIPFEAFAEPLHVNSADATIDATGLVLRNMNLTVGSLPVQGEYHYETLAPRPHRFRLVVPAASGSVLEKLLMPALRRGSFLTYAFNFGRVPEPDWLLNMRADGTIQSGALELGGNRFTRVRSRVIWEGTDVQFAGLQSQLGDATFAGQAIVHLAGRQPAYEVQGKLSALPWRSGKISAQGTLNTSGTGAELLANLRAAGSFDAEQIDLADLEPFQSVAGAFDWGWSARNPRLRLSQLVMKSESATYLGNAEMEGDGQVVLRISDGAKHIQAAGAILRGDVLKPVAP